MLFEILCFSIPVTEAAFLYLPTFVCFFQTFLSITSFTTLSSLGTERKYPPPGNVEKEGWKGQERHRKRVLQKQVNLSPSNLLLGHFVFCLPN